MREVVVIGGGLSGLAAAYELEQHNVDYTLIEVKRRLGGSIHTIKQDNFTIDMGAFALADTLDETWLASLGLSDALYPLDAGVVSFKQGTRALVDALEAKLVAPRLMRMAVSSIGQLENGRCAICLENGIMLDAGALIIALPARYAQRLFYGYITPLTEKLLDYQYDSIQQVALGFRTPDIPEHIPHLPDRDIVYIQRTDHLSRVPDSHTLLHFGLRSQPDQMESLEQVVKRLCAACALPAPVTAAMGYWPESDPALVDADEQAQWVRSLHEQLPERVALIGSDYTLHPSSQDGITRFDERITQGRTAAQKFIPSC